MNLSRHSVLLSKRVVCCATIDAALLLDARITNNDLSMLQVHTLGTIHPNAPVPLAKPHFRYLLVDEAAQATEPDLACAMAIVATDHGFSLPCHVTICGDARQLGPIIVSPEARAIGLDTSLLERLAERDVYRQHSVARRNRTRNPSVQWTLGTPFVDLTKNYRSATPILMLPSTLVSAPILLRNDHVLLTRGHSFTTKHWSHTPLRQPTILPCIGGRACRILASLLFFVESSETTFPSTRGHHFSTRLKSRPLYNTSCSSSGLTRLTVRSRPPRCLSSVRSGSKCGASVSRCARSACTTLMSAMSKLCKVQKSERSIRFDSAGARCLRLCVKQPRRHHFDSEVDANQMAAFRPRAKPRIDTRAQEVQRRNDSSERIAHCRRQSEHVDCELGLDSVSLGQIHHLTTQFRRLTRTGSHFTTFACATRATWANPSCDVACPCLPHLSSCALFRVEVRARAMGLLNFGALAQVQIRLRTVVPTTEARTRETTKTTKTSRMNSTMARSTRGSRPLASRLCLGWNKTGMPRIRRVPERERAERTID